MQSLKRFDSFPKLAREVQESTASGGLVTVFVAIILFFLAISEIVGFIHITKEFEFLVDPSRTQDNALQINLDMTVNTRCSYLRMDVLDAASESISVNIKHYPVEFASDGTVFAHDVSKNDDLNKISNGIFNGHEDEIHNIFKIAHIANKHKDIKHKDKKDDAGACRFVGSFNVHKVTGMLHVTALGHGHAGDYVPHEALNFTHRIDRLSFGVLYPGLMNPLDHTIEVAQANYVNFQYFLTVVPTIYIDNTKYFYNTLLTNQYAVTEHSTVLDTIHPQNFPGVYIKYSMEPISIRITAKRRGIIQFITRICGIIGGTYVTIGALFSFWRWSARFFEGKLAMT